MPIQRYLILASAVLVCFSYGCGKKTSEPVSKKIPTLTEAKDAKKAAASKNDDIFNEFYDEKASVPSSKNSASDVKETFSTRSTKKNAPASTSEVSDISFSENGTYVIQISCVKSEKFANNLVAQLKKKGYPAYVSQVVDPTPQLTGTYYRVRIGGFEGESIALGFAKNKLGSSYEFWVDKKSNDEIGLRSSQMGGSYSTQTYSEYAPTPSQPAAAAQTYTPPPPTEQQVAPTAPVETAPAPAPAAETPQATPVTESAPAQTATPAPAPAAQSPASAPASSDWGSDDWGTETK